MVRPAAKIENFHFDAPAWHTVAGTWASLVVYAVVSLIMGWLLLRQRTLSGGEPRREAPTPAPYGLPGTPLRTRVGGKEILSYSATGLE